MEQTQKRFVELQKLYFLYDTFDGANAKDVFQRLKNKAIFGSSVMYKKLINHIWFCSGECSIYHIEPCVNPGHAMYKNRGLGDIYRRFDICHIEVILFYARCIFTKYNTRINEACDDIIRYINIIENVVTAKKYNKRSAVESMFEDLANMYTNRKLGVCILCNDFSSHSHEINIGGYYDIKVCDTVYDVYKKIIFNMNNEKNFLEERDKLLLLLYTPKPLPKDTSNKIEKLVTSVFEKK